MDETSRQHNTRVHKSAAELPANARSMHKRGDTVAQQISSAHRREIALNRRNVDRLFETVLFLGKQGILFRGHDESINYLELLHFRSRECAELSCIYLVVYIIQAHKAKMKLYNGLVKVFKQLLLGNE